MSNLVGNPYCQFSHANALIIYMTMILLASPDQIVFSVLCLDKTVNIWINFEGVGKTFIALVYNQRYK